MLFSNLARKAFSFFSIMFMARHLGTAGFGVITFVIGFTELFVILTDFGLNTLTVREVARDKSLDQKYLGNIAVMKSVLVLIFFGFIAAAINILGYPSSTIQVVYIYGLHIILRAFSDLLYSLFRAFEEMEYQSFGGILSNAFVLTGVLIAVNREAGVAAFALVFVLASAADLVYASVICALKFRRPKFEVDWGFWKNSLKEAWSLGTISIFFIIYFRIDTVMLSLIKGDPDVGVYGAAFRASEIMIIFPTIFMTAVFPVMSSYFKDSLHSFKKAYEKSVQYLFYLALLLALLVTLFARPIINLVYGEKFSGAVPALQILVWASALMYVTSVQGSTFVAANRQMLRMKLLLIAVLANIILNMIIIPRYGFIGASVTTLFTEIVVLIVGVLMLEKQGYKVHFLRTWVSPLLGIAAAVGILVVLTRFSLNIYLNTAVCCCVYGAVVLAFGINKEDVRLFRYMFSRT